MKEETFEDYLMLKHAEQHIGTKETLVDNFDGWVSELLSVNEIIKYADQFATSQKQEMTKNISLLRQWLNEERITDPAKMVSNEEIKVFIEL